MNEREHLETVASALDPALAAYARREARDERRRALLEVLNAARQPNFATIRDVLIFLLEAA